MFKKSAPAPCLTVIFNERILTKRAKVDEARNASATKRNIVILNWLNVESLCHSTLLPVS